MRIEQILNDFFNSYSLLVLLACVLVALGFLIRATVKLRGEIERIDFDDSDPSSIGAKLREITLNYEEYRSKATRRLIFKVDPNTFIIDYLKTSFERTYWYRAGSIFTGISLMLTFFLIGVAVHKIGMSLPAIAEKKDLMSLGQPIAHLQQKFYVSLSGVLATIVYHAVAHFCSWLVVQKADTELKLREKYDYILRESEDLRLQHLQSIGAIESKEHLNSLVAQVSPVGETALTFREELKDLLKDLKNIDVTVGSFAENVTTRLESFIDKSVGERLAELLESQRASTERIASEISQVLGKSIGQELEKSFRDLAERLPAIVSGGAGDATRKMAEAVTNASASFETVAQSMPELITGVSKMLDQLHLQQQQSATASIQMNQDLMKSVKQAIESLAETSQQSLAKQSEMVNLLGEKANILASQTSDATKGLNIAVEAGTNSLSKATQDISGRVSEIEHSLGSLLSKVQQSNQDLLNNFNYSIEQFRGLTSGMSQSSSQIREVVTRFAEVAKNLEQAPISSKQLIDATSSAINSQNQKIEQYIVALASGSDRVVKTLVDEYERGVEKIAETFKTKIAGIEKETENIRKVYMSAGAFMADTAEVFETLTESVDGLNQTLTKQASKIGG